MIDAERVAAEPESGPHTDTSRSLLDRRIGGDDGGEFGVARQCHDRRRARAVDGAQAVDRRQTLGGAAAATGQVRQSRNAPDDRAQPGDQSGGQKDQWELV